MLTSKTTTSVDPWGEVTTRHLEGSIVETVYRGHCPRALVESVLELTPTVLAEVPKASWLLDMTAVTGTDPTARIPGYEILKAFRELGGNQFAVVLTSQTLRMILTAVSFAAGLPMKLFERRDDALRHLREGSAGLAAKPG